MLPLWIVVAAAVVKFLVCVKGPKTVLAAFVKPFGIKTNIRYAKLLVILLPTISSPFLNAFAQFCLVYIPSKGLV